MNHHDEAFLKRCILRLRLNCYKLSLKRISSDGAFQSLAAVTENDLEPYLASLLPTSTKRWPITDLKLYLSKYFVIRSQRFGGAKHVNKRILTMRPSIGNQWCFQSTGVMWSHLRVCISSKHHKFCSLSVKKQTELQQSMKRNGFEQLTNWWKQKDTGLKGLFSLT